jgi:hypothetical protein
LLNGNFNKIPRSVISLSEMEPVYNCDTKLMHPPPGVTPISPFKVFADL